MAKSIIVSDTQLAQLQQDLNKIINKQKKAKLQAILDELIANAEYAFSHKKQKGGQNEN